jgi:hypothetical protein
MRGRTGESITVNKLGSRGQAWRRKERAIAIFREREGSRVLIKSGMRR